MKRVGYWAEKMGVSASTAQRYMRRGIIPDAEQTLGGHWRAPYSFFAMRRASLAAGILSLDEGGNERAGHRNTRVPLELRKHFDGVFDVHSTVYKRGSLPYRLAMALSRAVDGLPVTLVELDYCDGYFREIVASDDRQDAFYEAMRCSVFAKWVPKEKHLAICRNAVKAGHVNRITLVVAYMLTYRGYAAGESREFAGLLLENWRILKGKKIADVNNQTWEVDDEDCFRPRLEWVEGSRSAFFRACPGGLQKEAARAAAILLGTEPPPNLMDEIQAMPRNKMRRSLHWIGHLQ